MFSKLLIFSFSAVLFLTLGCGLKLGEKNKEENIAEIKSASCVRQSMDQLKLFFAGDATDEQVSESLICLQNVLISFKDNIRGQKQNSYTPDEIANFLSKQFLKDDTEFSKEFLAEIMKLKVALVGGITKGITRNEIEAISNFVARLKPEVVKLNPHMKVIVSKWSPESDQQVKEKKFLDAKAALEVFLNRVALLLASTGRGYELNDLVNLVVEAAKFSKSDDEIINKISTAKTLIIKFKETMIGGNTSLTGSEWVPFAKTLGEIFSQSLRYKYFFDFLKDHQRAEKLKVHRQVFSDVLTLIHDLLYFKESHVFGTSELSDLVLTAQKLDYINAKPEQKKFTQKGLDSLLNALWQNILNKPEDRMAKKFLPGFNSTALQILTDELNYWFENQIIVAELFVDKNEYTKKDLLAELAKKTKTINSIELYKVVAANGLMNFDDKGYLKILTETNGLYHIKDLNSANLTRTFSRVFIRSYANDLERVNKLSGVTLDEAQFAFDQLKEFIFNLELVEPSNVTFIASRFREANLFLSVSNGDNIADFEEINHLVLHILSGIERADSLKDIAMNKCLKAKAEIMSRTEFNQNCLLDLYFNEENSFAEMPGFAKLKTEKDEKNELKVSPAENKVYYLNLLKAAGYVPNSSAPEPEKTVFLADANLFPHVVQYVEMIYFRHDTNRDGFLQKDEAIKAFPVFAELLRPAQQQFKFNDKELIGFFVWLLKKGSITPILDMKAFTKDYECNLNNDSKTCAKDWTINTSRIGIGRVFDLIARLTAPKPAPASPTTPAPAPKPEEPAPPVVPSAPAPAPAPAEPSPPAPTPSP